MPTVLITGANRGLGLEFARQYLADGWHVIATTRNPSTAADLDALGSEAAGRLSIESLEVGDHAQIDALARELRGQPIDLLLNNAGVFGAKFAADGNPGQKFGHIDYAAWRQVFEVNTLAPIRMAEALVENVAASDGKQIAAISSTVGSIAEGEPYGHVYAYGASKTALNKAMHYLATDLKPRGIFVGILCPGWVRTDMGTEAAPLSPPDSIAGLRRVLAESTLEDSGSFRNYQGNTVPW